MYDIRMLYFLIVLTFLKKLMLGKQVHQKTNICHYWYFLNYGLSFIQMSAIDVMIY